jgi:hypothetical protein
MWDMRRCPKTPPWDHLVVGGVVGVVGFAAAGTVLDTTASLPHISYLAEYPDLFYIPWGDTSTCA